MPIGQQAAWRAQADHAHIVGEIFPAELGADPALLRDLQNPLLPLRIAKRAAAGRSGGGQVIVDNRELASFTVFSVVSALVPPITTAR